MNKNINKYSVDHLSTIFEALEIIDKNNKKCLVVLEGAKAIGTVTDGDIRRTLLKGEKIQSNIKNAMNKDFSYILSDESEETKKLKMLKILDKSYDNVLPVVDKKLNVVDLIIDFTAKSELNNFQALIMAGGAGTRLKPITLDTPKPLISIGGEPIIFRIIKQIVNSGIQDINISVHYQYEKIIKEVGDGEQFSASINYIIEEEPMGTLGAVSKLDKNTNSTLLINADILTNMSFNLFIDDYIKSKTDMLMGIKEYSLNVPYGVVEVKQNEIDKFTEKPEYPYFISAGINILSSSIIQKIPSKKTDIPELLDIANDDFKIRPYLISEYWSDIGNLTDLQNASILFDSEDLNLEY